MELLLRARVHMDMLKYCPKANDPKAICDVWALRQIEISGLKKGLGHVMHWILFNVTVIVYEVLRTSLRVPDGSYGPY